MVKSSSDLITGLLFLAIGGLAIGMSSTYAMGSASRIGPGFYPFWLGVALSALGIGLVAQSLARRTRDGAGIRWDWLTLSKVLLSVVIFAAVLSTLGLVASVILLVLVSSLASHDFDVRIALLNAIAIAVGTVLVFVFGLRLHLPVWPNFSGLF